MPNTQHIRLLYSIGHCVQSWVEFPQMINSFANISCCFGLKTVLCGRWSANLDRRTGHSIDSELK